MPCSTSSPPAICSSFSSLPGCIHRPQAAGTTPHPLSVPLLILPDQRQQQGQHTYTHTTQRKNSHPLTPAWQLPSPLTSLLPGCPTACVTSCAGCQSACCQSFLGCAHCLTHHRPACMQGTYESWAAGLAKRWLKEVGVRMGVHACTQAPMRPLQFCTCDDCSCHGGTGDIARVVPACPTSCAAHRAEKL